MKFRQRIAWVALFSYLSLTFVTIYYFFELADQYNILALDHTRLYHSSKSERAEKMWTLWKHFPDVPYVVWMLLGTPLYLQVFCLIYACTKPEPKKYLLMYIVKFCNIFSTSQHITAHKNDHIASNTKLKSHETLPSNGHIYIVQA